MKGRGRKEEWRRIIEARMETIGFICELCRRRGSRYDPFDPIDGYHRIPRSKGGVDSRDNCIILCRSCNEEIHRPIRD